MCNKMRSALQTQAEIISKIVAVAEKIIDRQQGSAH